MLQENWILNMSEDGNIHNIYLETFTTYELIAMYVVQNVVSCTKLSNV